MTSNPPACLVGVMLQFLHMEKQPNRREFLKNALTGAVAAGALGATESAMAAENKSEQKIELYPGFDEDTKLLRATEDKREAAEKRKDNAEQKRLAQEVRALMTRIADKMTQAVEKLNLPK